MSGGLREYWGLAELSGLENTEQAVEFGRAFRELMSGVNRQLQLAAAQAQASDYESLDAQRTKLYEVYQKASALFDPREPSKAEPAIKRVLAAVTVLEEKASNLASGSTVARGEWQKRQADFDEVMLQIAELEDGGHPKAAVLRQLGEAIRERANDRHYRESAAAHDGLRPKFDQIYAHHMGLSNGTAERNGHNGTLGRAANGASPEFVANAAQQPQLAIAPSTPAAEVAQTPASSNTPTPPDPQSASPAAIDRQASCLVTVTNNTSAVLTLIDQGHERGDFMTFPNASIQPGGSTQFVSIETPESDDRGCKGFALWEVGEPGGCTWRVEWDNVEQGKNVSDSVLEGTRAAGFRGLEQIGQGDENVPTVFTISETGVAPPMPEPPPETPPANEIDDPVEPVLGATSVTFAVTDKESGEPIAGAAVSMAEVTGETDVDGMVQFQIDPGSYSFRVTSEGHEDASGSVEAVASENTERRIELEKEPVLVDTSVTFIVTDKESGEPIAGAAVSMAEVTGQTDGEGTVQFQIDPGSYDFRASTESHQDTSGTVEAVASTNTEVHIELEKEPDWLPPRESRQPTLRKGDKSVDGWVEYLQSLLNEHLGPGTVETNGIYGDRTSKAVWEFQRRFGCHQDGIVGNETWSVLRQGPKEKIGTDHRDPHTFVEAGAEARWMTEDTTFVQYASDTDELVMVVVSVGDTGIDDFEATVRVTTNGSADTMAIKIGPPISESDSGDAQAHRVRIPRFRATYGPGTHQVEAFLPQELGGDLWSGEVDIPEGSTPKPLGGPGSVAYSVTDSQTGEPIPLANVTISGETIDGESDGVFIDIPPGEHGFVAKAEGYKGRLGKVIVIPNQEVELKIALDPDGSTGTLGGPGSVSYSVADSQTGELIETVVVTIGEDTLDGHSTGIFMEVSSGEQPYRVTAEGYQSETGKILINPGLEAQLLVSLKRNRSKRPSGSKVGSVSYKITDSEKGELIETASVTVAGETIAGHGTGIFIDLPEGKQSYSVEAKGYEFESGSVTIIRGKEVELNISLLSELPPALAHYEFKVIDINTDDPIPGAKVSLNGKTKKTNSSGAVIFTEELAPGSYEYSATADGYEEFDDTVTIRSGTNFEKPVLLSPDSRNNTSVHKCYPSHSVPEYQAAPDGEMLPTMKQKIPAEVLKAASEVCVSTKSVIVGKLYKVVTEVKISRSIIKTILRELSIDPLQEVTMTILEKVGLAPKWSSIIVSVLTSKDTILSESHGEALSVRGKPVEYTVIFANGD